MDGIKDSIETELDEYNNKKAHVKTHNELIKEQVSELKSSLKKKEINREQAQALIQELYASEKTFPSDPFNFGDDLTSQRLFQKLHEHQGAYGVFSSDGRGILIKNSWQGL